MKSLICPICNKEITEENVKQLCKDPYEGSLPHGTCMVLAELDRLGAYK